MCVIRRLLPGHPFKVAIFGDAPNFLNYFRAAWRRVPLAYRRDLLKHWKPARRLDNFILAEAGAYWSRGEDVLATVGLRGLAMKFKPVIETMPACAAEFLIAHELAHVYQFAVRSVDAWMSEGDPAASRLIIEEEADEIARGWGFDFDALYDWKQANAKEAA